MLCVLLTTVPLFFFMVCRLLIVFLLVTSCFSVIVAICTWCCSIADDIVRELEVLLAKAGFATVADAVGTGRSDYL